jgi:hypothetical protein
MPLADQNAGHSRAGTRIEAPLERNRCTADALRPHQPAHRILPNPLSADGESHQADTAAGPRNEEPFRVNFFQKGSSYTISMEKQ